MLEAKYVVWILNNRYNKIGDQCNRHEMFQDEIEKTN